MRDVRKPIIIFGTGRTGSTLLHDMISRHDEVAWLSALCDRYPSRPGLSRALLMAVDYPGFGTILRKRIGPAECYNFWETHCRGFARPFRDLLPADVTLRTKVQLRGVLSGVLTSKRKRLVIKITGWPRTGFFSTLFEDAKFIHIMRDGRAAAYSLMHMPNWLGWRGPENWRWGPLPPALLEEWERHDRSFVALAGIQWRILMQAAEKARQFARQDSYLEVKYEQLCEEPMIVLEDVARVCELEWSNGFQKELHRYTLRSANHKWREGLTDAQRRELEEVMRPALRRYGYVE